MDSDRTEFRPDPGSIGRARQDQLRWVVWALAMTALATAMGVAAPRLGWTASRGWTVPLAVAVGVAGLGLVAATWWHRRRLARVLAGGQPVVVDGSGLLLPGTPLLPWSQVAAVVARRLRWAGLEITLVGGRQLRLVARHYGCGVDELAAAVARYVPVGDPDAAYRAWSEHWHGG